MTTIEPFLTSAITAGTPLLLAALGEIYAERSGVLNLGIEGMMAMGACTGFITAVLTSNLVLAILIASLTGGLLSLLHAFLCITLNSNQVVSGLALTIFGLGLSGFIGWSFTGLTIHPLQPLRIPILSEIPVFGVFFQRDPIVYLSYILCILSWLILFKTSIGLTIRSVGEDPKVADALGINVSLIRYSCVFFGGLLAGLAGAYLTLAWTPFWIEGMTAGRGWIALALVIVSLWNPAYAMLGAYLFGSLWVLYFRLPIKVSPWLLQTIPYISTILMLIALSRAKGWLGVPSSLGKPFRRE